MHHEPIIFAEGHCNFVDDSELLKAYDEIIEAIGWVCLDTKEFVASRCEFTDIAAGFIDFLQHATSGDPAKAVETRVPWVRPSEGRLHIVRARVKFYLTWEGYGYLIPAAKHMRELRVEKKVLIDSGLEALDKSSPVEVTFTYVHGFPKVLKIRML